MADLFGMSNQMLAGIALCLATVILYQKNLKILFNNGFTAYFCGF